MRQLRAFARARLSIAAVTLYCLVPAVEAGPPGPMPGGEVHSSLSREVHRLVAFGSGRTHAAAWIGAGQPAAPGNGRILVGVKGLERPTALHFRIDVTGACGSYSVR